MLINHIVIWSGGALYGDCFKANAKINCVAVISSLWLTKQVSDAFERLKVCFYWQTNLPLIKEELSIVFIIRAINSSGLVDSLVSR